MTDTTKMKPKAFRRATIAPPATYNSGSPRPPQTDLAQVAKVLSKATKMKGRR